MNLFQSIATWGLKYHHHTSILIMHIILRSCKSVHLKLSAWASNMDASLCMICFAFYRKMDQPLVTMTEIVHPHKCMQWPPVSSHVPQDSPLPTLWVTCLTVHLLSTESIWGCTCIHLNLNFEMVKIRVQHKSIIQVHSETLIPHVSLKSKFLFLLSKESFVESHLLLWRYMYCIACILAESQPNVPCECLALACLWYSVQSCTVM